MRRLPLLLFAASWFAPGFVLAHGGEHEEPGLSSLLSSFTWDPLTLACLVLPALLYARGARALWGRAGRGHGLRPWQVGSYAAGVVVTAIALLSPLDALSDALFSAHMSQHELLILVAAPLLVLGRPLVAFLHGLPAGARERVATVVKGPRFQASWRAVTNPFVLLVAHGVVLWAWHVPALFEAALGSEAVHAVQHFSFFVTAALFWWALVHGRYGRAGYGVAVLYVFATATQSGILGALLTVDRRLWYPTHEARTRALGLAPLEDQQLAGLIMWVPTAILFLVLALALFSAWLGEAERRAARSSVVRALGGPAPDSSVAPASKGADA